RAGPARPAGARGPVVRAPSDLVVEGGGVLVVRGRGRDPGPAGRDRQEPPGAGARSAAPALAPDARGAGAGLMRCFLVRRRLSAYRDGDLRPAEMQQISAHLDACSACARRWQSLRAALELLGDLPRLSPPETIASRVQDRLEVESRGPGLALLFRPF